MLTCPSCGKENPDGFQFCGFCAAPLTAQPAVPVHEERKVVTVLFCDLVGFTAASEAADPEDVRSRIRPYHARVRQDIERYGGTVEKFIGDAVMAVFGAPVAHEDDAERAVRAGLRILEAIAELNAEDPALSLQVRVGINTGEAVVALGARPEEGEGMVTGDVVNTASRLQGAAPVNAIAVSEQTYRATERVFDYEELEPVQVKGKAEPLAVFRPLAPRARFGADVLRTHTTPLVGRELEKPLLIGTFERSAKQRSCQLVTIVGEPGVGKTRLCAELSHYLDERPGLVRWRQGRCLPYGEGIAFWALGEIVKAECGILESDSPQVAEAKLERALPEDDPDRAWLKARLAPLVGAPAEPAAQEESFAAWRRFCESLAAQGPTVLVFEDLHWADESLLSFLEHLADWAEGVPLLVLCSARPELYEQHPTFGANARNAQRINLAPLTEEETARLIASLLERAVLPAETQQALLERAGGNPLYAEEFVRLFADRGEPGEVEVPDTVQALIAARLDTLSQERKTLLQDAAVLGKVFWAGALAEMGDREPGEVEQALHELARKELVRPVRTSSMEGEAEYGFWHLLVRDVCYQQIPRAARAARHRAAADWIERKAGERVEDLADVLAHHSLQALELTQAAGQTDEAEELEAAARRYLALAGERALALDVARAEQNLATALELTPASHPERASLLELWAKAALPRGQLKEAKDALEEALARYRQQDESVAAGRVLTALSAVRRRLGDPRQEEAIGEALALLEAELPGPELVAAHAQQASARFVGAAYPEAIAAAERALALAAELALPEPANALGARGLARCYLGERQGLEDVRRALALALEEGQGRYAAVLHNNLAVVSWQYEGPQAALAACRVGIDFCERRGIAEFALGIGGMSTTFLAELGQPEQAVAEAEPVAERMQAAGDVVFIEPRALQLRLLAERGAHEHAPAPDELVARAREGGEPQMCALAFAAAARMLLARLQHQQAQALLAELEQVPGIGADPYYTSVLPGLVRTALALDDAALASSLVEGVQPVTPLAEHVLAASHAQLAEAAGDNAQAAALYAEAAERWRDFGNVPERAYALLGQGRCLAALGKPGAEKPLREARDLFASMSYKPALAETEALLGESEAAAV
ncbi:MAG TPA: adenylate/guanylate cyclase domain-containing protein [Gaiellaceae bacterium]|nr:adenylate/guanylate cyclase domain-containing protein [Gaiellaceae bacterium]